MTKYVGGGCYQVSHQRTGYTMELTLETLHERLLEIDAEDQRVVFCRTIENPNLDPPLFQLFHDVKTYTPTLHIYRLAPNMVVIIE